MGEHDAIQPLGLQDLLYHPAEPSHGLIPLILYQSSTCFSGEG